MLSDGLLTIVKILRDKCYILISIEKTGHLPIYNTKFKLECYSCVGFFFKFC